MLEKGCGLRAGDNFLFYTVFADCSILYLVKNVSFHFAYAAQRFSCYISS